MYNFFLIIHVIVSILLILIVLFQAGKSLGLGGLMGGGSSDAIFTGAGGNDIMKKITAVLAVMFLATSFTLSMMSAKKPARSLMDIMPPAPVMPENDGFTIPGQESATTDEVAKSTAS